MKRGLPAIGTESVCPCCRNERYLCKDGRLRELGDAVRYLHIPDDMPYITTRCPLCIDLQGAVDDREVGIKYYFDEQHPEMRERYNIIRAAIREKFPDWKDENNEMYDKNEIIMTPEGQHCETCNDQRVICPGCGDRPSPKLFTGCGVDLRCPCCVDYKGALEDKYVFDRYYQQRRHEPFQAQIHKVIAAVKAKFPDWDPEKNLQQKPMKRQISLDNA